MEVVDRYWLVVVDMGSSILQISQNPRPLSRAFASGSLAQDSR